MKNTEIQAVIPGNLLSGATFSPWKGPNKGFQMLSCMTSIYGSLFLGHPREPLSGY